MFTTVEKALDAVHLDIRGQPTQSTPSPSMLYLIDQLSLERMRMHWPYVAIASGVIIGLGAVVVKVLLARRRQISARETGKTLIEGIGEMASQSALFVGILLIAAANLDTIAMLGASRSTLILSIVLAALLVLYLGVQLGRLLMRYQLYRLRGVLDTVSGEIVPKNVQMNERVGS